MGRCTWVALLLCCCSQSESDYGTARNEDGDDGGDGVTAETESGDTERESDDSGAPGDPDGGREVASGSTETETETETDDGLDSPSLSMLPVAQGNDPMLDASTLARPDSSTPLGDEAGAEEACSPPVTMILVSRSSAMFHSTLPNGGGEAFGPHEDRWEGARAGVQAVLDAGYVPLVRAFTGQSPADGGECPLIYEYDEGLPANDRLTEGFVGQTPLTEALIAAYSELSAATAGPKHLILVSDGMAELCDPWLLDKGIWCGHDPAIDEVQRAHAAGVRTSVVWLGDDLLDPGATEAASYLLNSLAHAAVGEIVQPPSDNLHCIAQESEFYRNEVPAEDFYENWRPWAAAEYGPDGYVYEEELQLVPENYDVGATLLGLLSEEPSCD